MDVVNNFNRLLTFNSGDEGLVGVVGSLNCRKATNRVCDTFLSAIHLMSHQLLLSISMLEFATEFTTPTHLSLVPFRSHDDAASSARRQHDKNAPINLPLTTEFH
ncbi:hypothetical protein DMENIID0001_015150 [Sergentomyia squamirostris]